jgi:hypothetical protein
MFGVAGWKDPFTCATLSRLTLPEKPYSTDPVGSANALPESCVGNGPPWT